MFSDAELERYARHIVLAGVGGPGQQKLKSAKVLVVGAGGLGSPVIEYLAAAGVGRLGLIDNDLISLSNLQRQPVHDTAGLGRRKVDSAAERAAAINPHVIVEVFPLRLTESNALALVRNYDVVADCSDNSATRYVVSDACFHAGKPLISAAVQQWDGSVTALKPYEKSPGGGPNPTYRCLFPEPVPEGWLPTCAEAGILGSLAGVIGSLQATEIIKEIIGIGENLVGRLLLYDARAARFETIVYAWDPANPLTGRGLAATAAE
jgi:molybdopterin-synthase adenylyltransferase